MCLVFATNSLQLYGTGSDWLSLIVFVLFAAVILLVIYYLAKFLFKVNKVMDIYLKKQKEEEEASQRKP